MKRRSSRVASLLSMLGLLAAPGLAAITGFEEGMTVSAEPGVVFTGNLAVEDVTDHAGPDPGTSLLSYRTFGAASPGPDAGPGCPVALHGDFNDPGLRAVVVRFDSSAIVAGTAAGLMGLIARDARGAVVDRAALVVSGDRLPTRAAVSLSVLGSEVATIELAGAGVCPAGGRLTLTVCDCDAAGAVRGTPRSDSLRGTAGSDVLCGFEGKDVLDGRGGEDCLLGGRGADILLGGEGEDLLFGGAGADLMDGEEGDDELHGGKGRDRLLGGPGNDVLFGEQRQDFMSGNPGDDVLWGGRGRDLIQGNRDQDELHGGRGDDTLRGGPDADFLSGDAGFDLCEGGSGVDTATASCEDSFNIP